MSNESSEAVLPQKRSWSKPSITVLGGGAVNFDTLKDDCCPSENTFLNTGPIFS